MRLRALCFMAGLLAFSPVALAQENARTSRAESTVLRPASTVAWRNYVSVPDGPCGHPMSIQTDCYSVCRPCGPLRPFCFLHRVGRMLDCLIPCNLCCKQGCGGGCGGTHGCVLGGRKWEHCNVCCGAPSCGSTTCCTNPCGSVFDSCCTPSCTTGGHCYGCSSALPASPALSDPFQDDPLPPKPTAEPATEVRRAAPRPARPVAAPARVTTASPRSQSPYKIVSAPATHSRIAGRPAASPSATKKSSSQSVLRKASAEETSKEPAQLRIDHSRAAPIVRSQSPEADAGYDVPANPLR